MATTDFLPFATDPTADVQSQADFAAAVSTAKGFSAGIAEPAQLNKVWRQASFIAAGVAHWLVNKGYNVPDDGDLDNLIANLTAALVNLDSPHFTGIPTAPTAAVGTNSTQLATMAALLNSNNAFMVEAANQAAEDAAWAAGARIVIRTDLLYLNNLALLMHFDGIDAGTFFLDSTESPKTITRVGTPTTSTTTPHFGTASLLYTGAGNYLTTPDAPNLYLGTDWTVECWHKLESAHLGTKHSFIASKGAAGNLNNAWQILLATGAGGHVLFVPSGNAPGINVAYAYAADTVNYHHLSFNSVAGVVTAYVDGVSVGSCTPGAGGVNPIYNGTGDLFIGGWNYGTANTEGDRMDEFIITTGMALRTANFTPPVAPFIS